MIDSDFGRLHKGEEKEAQEEQETKKKNPNCKTEWDRTREKRKQCLNASTAGADPSCPQRTHANANVSFNQCWAEEHGDVFVTFDLCTETLLFSSLCWRLTVCCASIQKESTFFFIQLENRI